MLGRRISPASSERIDVPDAVSKIIQKMTQKQIDDRYHSTSGVKYDLVEVQRLLGEGDSEGLSKFEIGLKDVPSFFVLPTAISGREKERKKIIEIIKQVAHRQERQDFSMRSGQLLGSTSGASTLSERFENAEAITRSSDTSSQVALSPILGPSPLGNLDSHKSRSSSQDLPNGNKPVNKPPLEVHNSRESIETTFSYDTAQRSIPRLEQSSNGIQSGSHVPGRQGSHIRMRRHPCELISITGAAGAGKSSLVQNAQTVIRQYGYFASAKFDPARKAPFEPLLRAMSSLFRQIFSESDVNSDYHNMIRRNIRGIWGTVCSMLDLPDNLINTEAEFVDKPATNKSQGINKSLRAEMMETGSLRSNRSGSIEAGSYTTSDARKGANTRSLKFSNVFIEILRVLSRRLICLCLDDINFADEESLDLVSTVINRKLGIVILTTCRDVTTLPSHIEQLLINGSANITSVKLAPLSEQEVIEYVATTLYRPVDHVLPLAVVCLEKSNGNPFYLRQMLETCYRKGCIWYSWKESVWDFDLDRVFAEFQSDSYGDQLNTNFVTRRLQDLPTAARAILAWASLLGTTFSFRLIQRLLSGELDYMEDREVENNGDCTKVTEIFTPQPVKNVIEGLQSALQAYVLVPGNHEDEFSFSHDRYISASASLRECSDSEKMHYIIVQVIMKYPNLDRRSLYAQAQHVCKAAKVIRQRSERRYHFRALLINAASKAIESGARPTALDYYETCLDLLQSDPWDETASDVFYPETLSLYAKAAELYWHQGRRSEAQNLLDSIFAGARSVSDKAPAWILQSKLFAQAGNIRGAFTALKTSLLELGLDVSASPTWEACDREYVELNSRLRSASFSDIIGKPLSTDQNMVAMGAVLIEAISAGFWSNSLLVCCTLRKRIARTTKLTFNQVLPMRSSHGLDASHPAKNLFSSRFRIFIPRHYRHWTECRLGFRSTDARCFKTAFKSIRRLICDWKDAGLELCIHIPSLRTFTRADQCPGRRYRTLDRLR